MRISSPPITHSDFYGIDTPKRESLIASGRSVEEINEFIGADSLAFLSIEGIYKAMGHKSRNNEFPQYTDHCFTGDYPTRLLDRSGQDIDKQLSLLVEENA